MPLRRTFLLRALAFASLALLAGCASVLSGGEVSPHDWNVQASTPDRQTLLIRTEFGGVASNCARFEGYEVQASETEVKVIASLWQNRSVSSCTADGASESLLLRLREPLGDRSLTGCGNDDCLQPAAGTDSPIVHTAQTSETIVVAMDGTLTVFDADTGEQQSNSSARGPIFGSDNVVVARHDESPAGIDPVSGEVVWARPDLYEPKAQIDNLVFACGRESEALAALDQTTGTSFWEAMEVLCPYVAGFDDTVVTLAHDPETDGGSKLFVLNRSTGKVVSEEVFDDGNDDQVQGYWGVAQSTDAMVIAGFQSDTVVIDASGQERSRSKVMLGEPVGFDGTYVVVQGIDGTGVFDVTTQEIVWSRPNTLASSPSNGQLAIGRTGGVELLETASGEQLWQAEFEHAGAMDASLTETHVIATTDLFVALLDRQTGDLLWWSELPQSVQTTIDLAETSDEKHSSAAFECSDTAELLLPTLQSGVPLYDYDRVETLDGLLEQSDVVIRADATSVRRVQTPTNPETGSEGVTVLKLADVDVLYPSEIQSFNTIMYASGWASDTPDPLGELIELQNVEVLAFAHLGVSGQESVEAHIQGLIIDCAGGDSPLSVIEPMPLDMLGETLEAIAVKVQQ